MRCYSCNQIFFFLKIHIINFIDYNIFTKQKINPFFNTAKKDQIGCLIRDSKRLIVTSPFFYKQNVIYTGIQMTPSSLMDKFLG